MSEDGLSKYQRKQLAKQRGNWTPPAAQVAVNIINRLERGEPVQPKPKKKPAQPPPKQRGLMNDLGTMPQELAEILSAAAAKLQEAEELARKILAASSVGLQTAEPRSLVAMIGGLALRTGNAAKRAGMILNAKAI